MTASNAREAILAALHRVIDPTTNKDVVSLNWAKTIGVGPGVAKIEYELPEHIAGSPIEEEIRKRTTAAALMVDGIEQVEIVARPKPTARATNTLPGVKNVIAVGAGKGGVGKSTLSVLLAAGMVRRGLKAGVLDADVYGPSIPKLTGTEGQMPEADEHGRILPPRSDDGLPVMSMGFLVPPDQAVVWRGPMAQKYVREFLDRGHWGELDHLIVDLPPGTGDIPLTLAQSIPLTGAVIGCTPQDVALIDALKALRMYQKLGVDALGMIENMSYYQNPATGQPEYIFGHGGVERAAKANNIPFLGGLPLVQLIRESGDAGTPMDAFTKSPAYVQEALNGILDKLLAQVQKRRSEATPLPQLRIS
jgi:ATP-binding protein involved in chromosome partitioning